jgi:hypothetical protein
MDIVGYIKRKFCKKPWEEPYDENQRKYREVFGIVDKFLLNYVGEKFIVFIDRDNDIDWVENTDFEGFTDEERRRFYEVIAKLDRAQAYPCMLLNEKHVIAFKRILGASYVAAFQKSFEGADETIEEAKQYVRHRNLEKARQIYLTWAGMLTLLALAFLPLIYYVTDLSFLSKEVSFCVVLGIAGAYFSIWQRYEDLLMKGFSTRILLALEAVSRLFVGGIAAYVVYLAYQCQLVFTLLSNVDIIYTCSFLGFIGGLFERFVPSLVESFANKNLTETNS